LFAAKKKYFKPKILPFKSLKAIITVQFPFEKVKKFPVKFDENEAKINFKISCVIMTVE